MAETYIPLRIEDDVMGLGGTLFCPSCGGNYLHHNHIDTYFRHKEDSAVGLAVTSESQFTTVENGQIGNPSPRRDGIRIKFWCENCDATPSMVIVQHKGSTYVGFEPEMSTVPYKPRYGKRN